MFNSNFSGEYSQSIIDSAQKAAELQFSAKEIDEIDKKISTSFQKAQKNQQQRLNAQELKNMYYQHELDRMKQAIQDLQSSSQEGTPYKEEMSRNKKVVDSSPLRNEFKQNQWQQKVLNEEDDEQENYQNIDELEEQNEQNEPNQFLKESEGNLQRAESILNEEVDTIEPRYSKQREENLSFEKQKKSIQPIERKQISTKQLKRNQQPTIGKKDIQRKQKEEQIQEIQELKQKSQGPQLKKLTLEQNIMKIGQKYQGESQTQKENGKGFFENIYGSDLCYQHLAKETQINGQIQKLKCQISKELETKDKNKDRRQVFQPKNKQPHCQKNVLEKKLISNTKHDEMQIKLFGIRRNLPCSECLYFLSQGLSSDLCSYHGKQNKDLPASKQVSKRFQKYL